MIQIYVNNNSKYYFNDQTLSVIQLKFIKSYYSSLVEVFFVHFTDVKN